MARIKIVTDTDSSIPSDIAIKYGILQVPINVHFGQETFAAVDDIDDTQLFERVDRDGKLPTTSAPSPGRFAQAFTQAFDEGADEVICFTVSSKVSAVYNAAISAADLLQNESIRIVDTSSLSMGQGFMVLAAAEALLNGATSQEAIDQALEAGRKAHLYVALSTLKYLAMSGRVGHLAAGLAGLLDVRPILTVKDGKLDLLERARTEKKSWSRVVELSQQAISGKKLERLAFVHVNAKDKLHEFKENLSKVLPCPDETITAELTPGLSVHSGAGVVGLVFITGN